MADSYVIYNSAGVPATFVHPDPNFPFDPSHPAWNEPGGVQVKMTRADYDACARDTVNASNLAIMQATVTAATAINPTVGAKIQTHITALNAVVNPLPVVPAVKL
jgi:hypothetical protein